MPRIFPSILSVIALLALLIETFGLDLSLVMLHNFSVSAVSHTNSFDPDTWSVIQSEYFGIYGQGTEKYIEVIDLAIKEGFLVKAGAFIKVPDENGDPLIVKGEKMQWQGNAKFRQYCIDHPDFFEDLKNKISGNTLKDSLENLSEEEVNEIKQSEQELEEEMKEIDDDIIEEAKKKKNKKDKE